MPFGENGGASGTSLRGDPAARSVATEAGRKALAARLGQRPKSSFSVRRQIAFPVATAVEDAQDHRHEASELIRSLIQKIVLTPDPHSSGLLIDVHGDLAGILNIAVGETESEELDMKQIRLVVGLPEPVAADVPPRVGAAARMRALQDANMKVGKMVGPSGQFAN